MNNKHVLLELWGSDPVILNQPKVIQELLLSTSIVTNSTIVNTYVYPFPTQGVTGFALLKESHISIHTWPEKGYLAADIFTCGAKVHPLKGCQHLIKSLNPEKWLIHLINKGQFNIDQPNFIYDQVKIYYSKDSNDKWFPGSPQGIIPSNQSCKYQEGNKCYRLGIEELCIEGCEWLKR